MNLGVTVSCAGIVKCYITRKTDGILDSVNGPCRIGAICRSSCFDTTGRQVTNKRNIQDFMPNLEDKAANLSFLAGL